MTINETIIFKWESGQGVSEIAEAMTMEYTLIYKIIMDHIKKMEGGE